MTKKFGIIGNPVKHSLSPVLHNYWFNKYEIDATYSILNTQENDLMKIIDNLKQSKINGVNVTLPYKQKIAPLVDILINDAKITSSVNTLYLNSDGMLVGENTDVFGLQAAYLKEIDNVTDKKALIIGAGGVSPSVILSLQKSGVQNISITNRTHEKCLFLKRKFNHLNIVDWKNLKDELINFDLIINATSLGLKNGLDFDFNFDIVKRDLIFIDTIYNPLETKTLKFLRGKDLKTFNGLEMFIYQGQKSFYLWNKLNPEIDQKLVELLISKLK